MKIISSLCGRVGLVVSLMVAGLGFGHAQAASDPFPAFATEILRGLDKADIKQFSAVAGYGAPRLALSPFEASDSPVPSARANEFNDRLLSALQRQAGNRYRFAVRGGLEKLIKDIKQSGLSETETQARISDLRKNARADILISGRLRKEGNDAVLSYQAIGIETGDLFASTAPRRIALTRRPTSTFVADQTATRVSETAPESARSKVAETEWLLSEHGYDPGPVDGVITPQTRAALSAYQRDSALPVNGRMTRRVVENLRLDTR